MSLHIAVDLGGTTARIAGYETLGSEDYVERETFDVQKVDKEADHATKTSAYRHDFANLLATIELVDLHPESITLAVAGKVNSNRQLLLGAGNLIHWVGEPIVLHLGAHFDCPIMLGNDAEAAALAEALHGHGQEQDFLTMIWGSGVGGCAAYWRDGKPYAFPTEVGHLQMQEDSGRLCGCGQANCLESHVGGNNLGNPKELDKFTWEMIGRRMAEGVYNALLLHPVPLVVFTGGVACKQKWLLPYIEEQLTEQMKMVEPPKVVLSKFGESAGTHGALALLGRRLLNGSEVPVS